MSAPAKFSLPRFSHPVSEWGATVRLVATSAGVDPTKGDHWCFLAPLVFAALPQNVSASAPKTGVPEDLLGFLEGYDGLKPTLSNLMTKRLTDETTPSRFFSDLVGELTKAMPKGTADNVIKVLAFERLAATLPPDIKPALVLQDMDKPPPVALLKKLDSAFINGERGNQTISAVANAGTSALDQLTARFDRLEGNFAKLNETLCAKMSGDSEQRRQMTCYSCGKVGHTSRVCNNRSRQGQSSQQCYNCRQLGHFARECPERSNQGSSAPRCANCGRMGHTESQCWRRQNENGQPNSYRNPQVSGSSTEAQTGRQERATWGNE